MTSPDWKLTSQESFASRHIGPRPSDVKAMLTELQVESLDELVNQTVPANIRLNKTLDLAPAESEVDFLARLKEVSQKNKIWKTHIGMGYYNTHTPHVILRNVLENPGWYTPYTPYQAEIAQGRLEGLLNFQTCVSDLTGLEVANASLLDEATAAAEAMMMLYRLQSRNKKNADVFLVSSRTFPQTLDVLKARAAPLGVNLKILPPEEMVFGEAIFGCLLQNPDNFGGVTDLTDLIQKAHEANVLVAVATDLLSLALCKSPGEMGADVAFGNSQRFGVPLGYGGPHAAFFSCREQHVRETPGRIIGVSKDRLGSPAYRMSLQTREQHIRREKAKSNICTAQALLANIAGLYAVWHGPEGVKKIALKTHQLTALLSESLTSLGWTQKNSHYFDTLHLTGGSVDSKTIRQAAEQEKINLRYFDDGSIGISLDETTNVADVQNLIAVFAEASGQEAPTLNGDSSLEEPDYPETIKRTSDYLTHPVFNSHHSETEMMRYLKSLERKDIGLDTSMIPLGSCTMKLNAAAEMMPVTWKEFGAIHPFVPAEQAAGYGEIIDDLEVALCKITGFAAVSLQPNSGAQGEFSGLMVIRAWHHDRGDTHRNIALIPSSAHGTNPASAVMAGMKVVVIKCDELGNIDLDDLKAKCEQYKDTLSSLMVTYPSTFGVFEETITDICQIVHDHGGLVYMDGANMNAQVGLTSPARIGADVCHLNLHKTFSIPHGGGGPGMGPIAVTENLAPFLPGHSQVKMGGTKGIPAISAAPWGSPSILLISYAYIHLLGIDGAVEATKVAILNANYLKAKLEKSYDILFSNSQGRVAHEMIFDLRSFKKSAGVTEEDVAKRLMDYGFHAPTVSWPVMGTMMIEPTESEPREELDRFVAALIEIRQEIQEIIDGKASAEDNVLKNAPHAVQEVSSDTWTHAYSRKQAAYPLPFVKNSKVWPAVARIDNPYGDRNLVCSCPPLENYQELGAAHSS